MRPVASKGQRAIKPRQSDNLLEELANVLQDQRFALPVGIAVETYQLCQHRALHEVDFGAIDHNLVHRGLIQNQPRGVDQI